MFTYSKSFLFVSLLAGLFLSAGCNKQKQAAAGPQGPPIVPVTVAAATQESVPLELRIVGTAEASAIVQVKSQIAGELVKVNFTEGQNVEKGALLFEIDSRPYRETLRQAEAAVVRDQAQVKQAEAALARDAAQAKTAQSDEARYAELVKAGVISKSQYDQYRNSADVSREAARATQATIESARAAVQADLATVDRAKLDISYCQIHAPLSGRTGNLLVHGGNLVKANDVPLVVIHQVSPMFVNFSVPEQHLNAIRRLNAAQKLPVRVFAQDNPSQMAQGKLAVIDNTVDSATGTIKLKATFDNHNGVLWPGQFLNVVLTLDTVKNATVIPSEALQAGQQGQMVYVVKPDKTVDMRLVTAGRSFQGKVVIEKGVNPGENVVTDGHLMLFPGATVKLVEPSQKPPAGKS